MTKKKTFICVECTKEFSIKDMQYPNWCTSCVDLENKRHFSNDVVGHASSNSGFKPALLSRPPKYAINPSEWHLFGY